MKKFTQIIVTILILLTMTSGLIGCGNNGGGGGDEKPPIVAVKEVESVFILYNGKKVSGGIISVDLTVNELKLTAEVKTTGGADGTVTYLSSDPAVAEITTAGAVTLKKKGETVISAQAGKKTHRIVLVVGDDFSPTVEKYTITVNGGTSNVTSAAAGEQVTLTAATADFEKENKEFVKWEYLDATTNLPLENLWINGNIFRMPNTNVIVRAIFKEKLYSLNVVGGTVKSVISDGEIFVAEGTQDKDIITYKVPFASSVTVQADEEKDGEMFVGWDYAVRKNRVGKSGATEFTFDMPNETLTLFGAFSKVSPLNFNYATFSRNNEQIIDGILDSEMTADPTFEGMNGYRFNIPGNRYLDSSSSYKVENFTGVDKFSTLRFGSQTVKVIFKNNSDLEMTLEFYAVSYMAVATSGVVTLAPHEVKEAMFVASAGFHNPSFAVVLRKALTGGPEMVSLDVVYEVADTFPDGDPQFHVIDAEYVELAARMPENPDFPAGTGIRGDCYATETGAPSDPTGTSFGGRKNVNNSNGITNLVTRDDYIGYDLTPSPYITAKISNLPVFDPANPEITVYFRLINGNKETGTFNFGLGTAESPIDDASRISKIITVQDGDTLTFGITIKRVSATDNVYFTIIKEKIDSINGGDYNLIIQMMYNNKIGVQNADIIAKA